MCVGVYFEQITQNRLSEEVALSRNLNVQRELASHMDI